MGCSVSRGPRLFKWKMLRKSGPYALSLGEVWGFPLKVMPSFSAVCLDLPSIPLIVAHNLVLSVLWYMLSTNSLHGLLL